MTVPDPPSPFTSDDEVLDVGTVLYRVHSDRFVASAFNPGVGAPTRFAFFGAPVVPVLYAGDTEDVAISESVLHDVPRRGGIVTDREFGGKRCSRIVVRRRLRLASLVGYGPRRLDVDADAVCATDASEYPSTVRWAEAAHDAGFDGLAYPSRQASGRRAVVLFGDRVDEADFDVDRSYQWFFDDLDGFVRLHALCTRIGVQLLRLV